MESYSLLQVITPSLAGSLGYCKNYANGKRISPMRYDLITCHARMGGSHDCFTSQVRKDGRVFHRSEARTRFAI